MVFFWFFFAEGEPWVIIGYDRGDIWLEYRVEGCITSSLGGWFIYGFVREGLSSFFLKKKTSVEGVFSSVFSPLFLHEIHPYL